MGVVTSVNHTLSHDVVRLRVLMKSLLTEVKKHVVSKILLTVSRVFMQHNVETLLYISQFHCFERVKQPVNLVSLL